MSPYETLANAIIQQAATDHRAAIKFLKGHPHIKELDKIVAEQIRERKARIKERRENNLPPVTEPKSDEEKLLHRILASEAMVADTEMFFLSDWFCELTKLDGKTLLNRIKEMEAEKA